MNLLYREHLGASNSAGIYGRNLATRNQKELPNANAFGKWVGTLVASFSDIKEG